MKHHTRQPMMSQWQYQIIAKKTNERQIQKQLFRGVLLNRIVRKISQNSQEYICNLFLQSTSGRLPLTKTN